MKKSQGPISLKHLEGDTAPLFNIKTLDGKAINLEDYRGKTVLLYFWATWHKPCLASVPKLKRFYKRLSRYDDFEMISLSLDEDDYNLRRCVEKYKPGWPQARIGLHSKLSADYGVGDKVPRYILIGPNGKILLDQESNWTKIKVAVGKASVK